MDGSDVKDEGTLEMTLLDEANKLADDIREYAPDTNIEIMIRDLIKEIERLQSEKIAKS